MTLDVGTLAGYLTLDVSGVTRGMAAAQAAVKAGTAQMAAAQDTATKASTAHAAALGKTAESANRARKVVDDFVTAGVRTTTLGDALTGVRGKVAATEAAMSGLAILSRTALFRPGGTLTSARMLRTALMASMMAAICC